MKKKGKILGIIGGMGTHAGLYFTGSFIKEWEEVYKIKKEWEYPRFILDNNCKLPSRVRAIIYQEESPVRGIIESIEHLELCGATVIVIPCNTAHYFMEEIRRDVKADVIDMIELLFNHMEHERVSKISVLASEGTIVADIYGRYKKNIDVNYVKDRKNLRKIIEDVKTNKVSLSTMNIFRTLLNKKTVNVLGCTEFSLLYNKKKDFFKGYRVIDPEKILISYLVRILK